MVMKRLETTNQTTQLFWQCECQDGNGFDFVKFKLDNPVCLKCNSVHWNSADAYIDNVTDKLRAQRDFIFKNFSKFERKEFYKPLRILYEQVIKGDVPIELFKDTNSTEKRVARRCSYCYNGMNKGYVINDGEDYACSDDCVLFTNPDEDDTYWTEWEDERDFQWLEVNGTLHEIA